MTKRKDKSKRKATKTIVLQVAPPTVKTVEIKKEEMEDLGNCNGCGQPLKRTAFNSLMDAVRCVNPRCMLFRDVIRRIHRGNPRPKAAPAKVAKPFDLALAKMTPEGQALLNARADEIIALGDAEVALRFALGRNRPTKNGRKSWSISSTEQSRAKVGNNGRQEVIFKA